jgi:hypothetical protein
MQEVEHEVKPTCSIQKIERNVYALVGAVSITLENAGLAAQADEFILQSISMKDYDEVLALSQNYVESK